MTNRRVRSERGAVTAETAVVLPLLAAFAVGMVWLVTVGVTQARAVDAAREVARAAARGEAPAQAIGWGRKVAPARSRIVIGGGAEEIRVRVSAPVRGPSGLFAFLPDFTIRAEAVAAPEAR